MNCTISQAAQQYHLEPYTLRYYEKEGILSSHKSTGGIRFYTAEDLEQLEMVCCLKSTGMSIKDIKKYFDLCAQGDDTAEQRLEIFYEQRRHILDEIENLKRHLTKIDCKIQCYKEKCGAK